MLGECANMLLPFTMTLRFTSVLTHSDNSGHTTALRSVQIVPFGNDFVCLQPLAEIVRSRVNCSQ